MTRRILCLALLVGILSGCSALNTPPALQQGDGVATITEQPQSFAPEQSAPTADLPETKTTQDTQPLSPSATAALPESTRPFSPATATPNLSVTPRAAYDACALEPGRIITGAVETRLVRLPLEYRVYLPPCYDDRLDERYPTLYLFHGQSYNDDQWDRMGADETADRLIADGEIPPLIIVMPFDRYGGQPTETGFSDAFIKQLVPVIEGEFRTRPERRYRAVGGLSRGAGWAIHFGFAHWQMFGHVGAHSAAVFHTDAQRMRSWMGEIPSEEYPQVYLDIGDRDRPEIMRSTLWFRDLLNLYDVPHEWHLFSGYHSEEYWTAHMEDYLRWYTQDW